MSNTEKFLNALRGEKTAKLFQKLYGNKPGVLERQQKRYSNLVQQFQSFNPGEGELFLFSTPGRTEVGGNHTDHNAGRVLAAAVDLDAIAAVSKNDRNQIRIKSEGYPEDLIDLNELSPVEKEKFTSAALIRGVAARMKELGYQTGGFDAYTTSNVLKGSGLSSSAAFEVLIVSIINHLYNNAKVDDILNAQIAQYAENNYFGKPCGLMDQTTCAVGGFVNIDFQDFQNPLVKKVSFDFASCGYTMVIIDTGGNHADLTGDYAALEHEMKSVAQAFGGRVLRDFSEDIVLDNIATLRDQLKNDRAILRALHFYSDDQRVVEEVHALETNDFNRFLKLIIESGYSSWMCCQNCYSSKNIEEQGISVALAVTERLLKGRGAWRVHGGGFAGTIQVFCPNDLLTGYLQKMRGIFGEKACHEVMIRPVGTTRVEVK